MENPYAEWESIIESVNNTRLQEAFCGKLLKESRMKLEESERQLARANQDVTDWKTKAENLQKLIQLRNNEIEKMNSTAKKFERNLKLKSENLEICQTELEKNLAEKAKLNACVKNVSMLKAVINAVKNHIN